MSDAPTLDFYEREAPRYTLAGAQGPHRQLDPFLDRLEPGARILELGCGAGRDALRMIERGFVVDATDGSAAMARKASERIGQEVRVLLFGELEACEEYDAVWAHASLHHVELPELHDALARIARALKPGGWHFANFKLGQGADRDSLGRLYTFASEAEMQATYAAVLGWEIVEAAVYEDGGFDGVMRDWMALTMSKAHSPR